MCHIYTDIQEVIKSVRASRPGVIGSVRLTWVPGLKPRPYAKTGSPFKHETIVPANTFASVCG